MKFTQVGAIGLALLSTTAAGFRVFLDGPEDSTAGLDKRSLGAISERDNMDMSGSGLFEVRSADADEVDHFRYKRTAGSTANANLVETLARREAGSTGSRHQYKKCRAGRRKKSKKNKKKPAAAATTTPVVVEANAIVPTSSTEAAAAPATTSSVEATTSASSTRSSSSAQAAPSAGTSNTRGLIGFTSSNCGPSGATEDKPNGTQEFLNCGLSRSRPNSGWTPPAGITVDMLAYVSIEEALAMNSVWEPCRPFVALFERFGAETDLPPILLASIALQESTCNPSVLGDNGGAVGLMQITRDKCNGQGTAGCADPTYNIGTGARYLRSEINNANGHVLEALGRYNGWYPGLTYSGATAAAYGDCCVCQNNLDYFEQILNGWLQGRVGYDFGNIGNLDVCGNH